jgi:hypothetical protein
MDGFTATGCSNGNTLVKHSQYNWTLISDAVRVVIINKNAITRAAIAFLFVHSELYHNDFTIVIDKIT